MGVEHEQRVIDSLAGHLARRGVLEPGRLPERVPSKLGLQDWAWARFWVFGRGAMVVAFFLRPEPTEAEVETATASVVRSADRLLAGSVPLKSSHYWAGEAGGSTDGR